MLAKQALAPPSPVFSQRSQFNDCHVHRPIPPLLARRSIMGSQRDFMLELIGKLSRFSSLSLSLSLSQGGSGSWSSRTISFGGDRVTKADAAAARPGWGLFGEFFIHVYVF
jgi:hypothetical protein